jgi:hypothetical protein
MRVRDFLNFPNTHKEFPMSDQAKNETTNDDTGEGLAQQLINRLGEVEAELTKAKAAIAKAERRRAVERALAGQQVKDITVAADLIEETGDTATDPQQLARELRRNKPGLFKAGLTGATTTQATTGNQQLVVLRERARQGDRASLLLYLRARRGDK